MSRLKKFFRSPITYICMAVVVAAAVVCACCLTLIPRGKKPNKPEVEILTPQQKEFLQAIANNQSSSSEVEVFSCSFADGLFEDNQKILNVFYCDDTRAVVEVETTTIDGLVTIVEKTIEVFEVQNGVATAFVVGDTLEDCSYVSCDGVNLVLSRTVEYSDGTKTTQGLVDLETKSVVVDFETYDEIAFANGHMMLLRDASDDEDDVSLFELSFYKNGEMELVVQNVFEYKYFDSFVSVFSLDEYAIYFVDETITKGFAVADIVYESDSADAVEINGQTYEPNLYWEDIQQINNEKYYLNIILIGTEQDHNYEERDGVLVDYYKNFNYEIDFNKKTVELMTKQDCRYNYTYFGSANAYAVTKYSFQTTDAAYETSYYDARGNLFWTIENGEVLHSFGDTLVLKTKTEVCICDQKLNHLLDIKSDTMMYFSGDFLIYSIDGGYRVSDKNGKNLINSFADYISGNVNGKLLYGTYGETDWSMHLLDTKTGFVSDVDDIDSAVYTDLIGVECLLIEENGAAFAYTSQKTYCCEELETKKVGNNIFLQLVLGNYEFAQIKLQQNHLEVSVDSEYQTENVDDQVIYISDDFEISDLTGASWGERKDKIVLAIKWPGATSESWPKTIYPNDNHTNVEVTSGNFKLVASWSYTTKGHKGWGNAWGLDLGKTCDFNYTSNTGYEIYKIDFRQKKRKGDGGGDVTGVQWTLEKYNKGESAGYSVCSGADSNPGIVSGSYAKSVSSGKEYYHLQYETSTYIDEGNMWVDVYLRPRTYTLNYNSHGGGSKSSTTVTYQGTYNGKLAGVTKTGYDFAGWWTAETGGTQYTDSTQVTTKSAHTIHAHWKAYAYTVAFNGNGATSGSMSNQSFSYGTAQNLRANAFSRTGYTFKGWATSSTGSVSYTDKKSVNNLTSTKGGTVTLYAVWEPIKYNIAFNKNNNNASGKKIGITNISYNQEVALSDIGQDTGITYSGAIFAGWAKSAGGNVEIDNCATVKNLTTTDGATVTLYAVWKVPIYVTDSTSKPSENDIIAYYLSNNSSKMYKKNGGEGKDSKTFLKLGIMRPGYYTYFDVASFDGEITTTAPEPVSVTPNNNIYSWDHTYSIGGNFQVQYSYRYNSSSASNDITISYLGNSGTYSKPVVIRLLKVDLRVDPNGGAFGNSEDSRVYTIPKNAGGQIISDWVGLPGNDGWTDLPTRVGYSLNDTGPWLVGSNATKNLPNQLTGNVTVKANWAVNKYTVVFNKNATDATGSMGGQSFTYGTAQTLRANAFSRTGYTFKGWATSADGAKVYDNGQQVNNLTTAENGTVNLYAVWEANKLTATFDANGGKFADNSTKKNIDQTYDQPHVFPAQPTRTGWTFAG